MNEFLSVWHQEYLWRALLAGIGISLLSGPFGVFVIWQRMAFFGDTLAHSGLLGITLAILFQVHFMLGVGMVALVLALLLFFMQSHSRLSHDALLGILSPATLAVGLIALNCLDTVQVDVMGFLFGDLLAITWSEVLYIGVGVLSGLFILAWIWPSLLRLTLDRDLAQVEGVAVKRVQLCFVLLLALIVAIAVKMVGVLLVTAMLIIPAAAARFFANTPERMALGACLVGMFATLGGLTTAVGFDWPVGPTIVVGLAVLFLLSAALNKLSN